MQERSIFQLVMSQGPKPGHVFELPRSTVSIGRDPGNQVLIDDSQISRQHARITPQGGLMVLEDLGSTNGTTVNGLRISAPHTLAHGDEIGLGDNVTLIFHGRPAGDAGDTVVAPRAAYTGPPATQFPPTYQASTPPAYGEASYLAEQADAPDYAQPATLVSGTYVEDYPEYVEETERNWALLGAGCVLVAIVIGLLIAIYLYFLAPASIVDPIADFLAGFGINIP